MEGLSFQGAFEEREPMQADADGFNFAEDSTAASSASGPTDSIIDELVQTQERADAECISSSFFFLILSLLL